MKVLHAGDYADSVADSGCLDFALWPFSFQVAAQSGAAHSNGDLSNSQGEKDVGVECEQGGCDGRD